MATNAINDGEITPENNDKTESSSLTKDESNIVVGDSLFHLLDGRWTFWYTHRPTTFRNSSVNYDSCLKKLGSFVRSVFYILFDKIFYLGTFGSIEEFWCYYDHMKFPSELPFYRLNFQKKIKNKNLISFLFLVTFIYFKKI